MNRRFYLCFNLLQFLITCIMTEEAARTDLDAGELKRASDIEGTAADAALLPLIANDNVHCNTSGNDIRLGLGSGEEAS